MLLLPSWPDLFRPSRSIWHRPTQLIEIVAARPAMTRGYSFPRRVFRGRAVKSILSSSAPDECGAFSLLPFATEAKGSGTPTGVSSNLRTGQVRRRANAPASPVGVPPRLSPRGLTSPKAQPRPCFLGRGLAGVTDLRLSQSSEHLARRS